MTEIPLTASELARRIRTLRVRAGVTQDRASGTLGLSRPNYIMREKGRTSFRFEEIMKLSSLIKFSWDVLVAKNFQKAAGFPLIKEGDLRKAHQWKRLRPSPPGGNT